MTLAGVIHNAPKSKSPRQSPTDNADARGVFIRKLLVWQDYPFRANLKRLKL
jgi:hypothetical protein